MRGGFRGGRRGGGGGPGRFGAPYARFSARPPPFDFFTTVDVFDRKTENDDAFTQEIIARANTLTPSDAKVASLAAFTEKVKSALIRIKVDNSVSGVKVEDIHEAGSIVKDTALNYAHVGDVVVILSTLPTLENAAALGNKVVEHMKADSKEVIGCVPKDYGCLITSSESEVRILITTLPENAVRLEPELHLSERIMMINYFAIRHANWFKSASAVSPIKSLVRVLKDVRNRYEGLKPLSVWALEFLCHYCLMNNPTSHDQREPQPLNLGAAFIRFLQCISAGLFLPNTPILIDPTNQGLRIGFDLTLEEMDKLCMTAQTLLRISVSGIGGFKAVIGSNPAYSKTDLTTSETSWSGMTFFPLDKACKPDCMKPKFPEGDLENVDMSETNEPAE